MSVRADKRVRNCVQLSLLWFCIFYLTCAAQSPPVGEFVFPGEIQAPLLAGDERFRPGIGGPCFHIGSRCEPHRVLRPPPSSNSCRRHINSSAPAERHIPLKPDTTRLVASKELIRNGQRQRSLTMCIRLVLPSSLCRMSRLQFFVVGFVSSSSPVRKKG